MSQEEINKQKIQLLQWNDLRLLWKQIKNKKTPGWKSGKALEYLILRAFELNGAEVRYPFSVHMYKNEVEQIDGVVHIGNLSCLIECKDYGNEKDPKKQTAINFGPLAKLRSQLMRRPPQTLGSFFTTSGYTEPALILARFTSPQTIILWEKEHLEHALINENIADLLVKKYRYHVETGEPNLDVTIF